MRPLLLLFPGLALHLGAQAQCLIGNSNAPGSDPTNVEIGQSFMPTCDGLVEYVEIYCTTGGTNVAGTLKIYSGSTVTSTPIHTQAVPATDVAAGTYLRVQLTAPVSAVSFSQLTFELPMSLTIPFSGGNPYPGGRMFYNGGNAALGNDHAQGVMPGADGGAGKSAGTMNGPSPAEGPGSVESNGLEGSKPP